MFNGMVSCSSCPRRRDSIFRSLSGVGLERLDDSKVVQTIPPGRHLYHEGGPALAVFCVREGRVRICRSTGRSQDVLIEIKGPGSILGLSATLSGKPHASSTVTSTHVKVCTIPRHTMLDLIEASPSFTRGLVTHLARTTQVYVDKVVNFACRQVPQRLAGLLTDLADQEEAALKTPVVVRVRRTDLAQMAGTSSESVSRVLKRLKDREMIAVSRREIKITQPDLLRLVWEGKLRV